MPSRRYIHVIPHPFNVFDELFACYQAATSRLKWMSVISWPGFSAQSPEWQDPNNVIILWWCHFPDLIRVVPPQRKALFALRYTESIGHPEKLWSPILAGFIGYLKIPEVIIVGAPSAARFIQSHCRKVVFAPVGYDPTIMGMPDWSKAKEHDLICYGSPYGRRKWIYPALERHFGKRMVFLTKGPYGLERKRLCDGCRAILHVGHSEEPGFPQLRLWESIASSTVLITEKRDVWPAVPGKHYIEIPEAKKENMGGFVAQVEQALRLPFQDIARRAHAELCTYTVDRSMEYITAVI